VFPATSGLDRQLIFGNLGSDTLMLLVLWVYWNVGLGLVDDKIGIAKYLVE
jgi:hypothetical protein